MSHQRQSVQERSLDNETLADPEVSRVRTEEDHHHNKIMSTATTTETNHSGAPDVATPVLEKDFSNGHGAYANGHHQHLDATHDSETALRKMRTAGSISISPELFEKLYLSPKNQVSGDLRTKFANPTPLALIGFLISLMPLSMDLMGWRGAGGNGAASIGVYYFMGGLLMTLSSIGEFILGNTFSFVVFGTFGGFWMGWAATLHPFFGAAAAYSPTGDAIEGMNSIGFRSSFAFFFVAMGVLCFIFLICSLRTNVCFFVIFLTLVLGFSFLAGAYFEANNGNIAAAGRLQTAAGAVTFVTCLFGWWIFIAIMLASLDFPFALPVGDLQGYIKGASERVKVKDSV